MGYSGYMVGLFMVLVVGINMLGNIGVGCWMLCGIWFGVVLLFGYFVMVLGVVVVFGVVGYLVW